MRYLEKKSALVAGMALALMAVTAGFSYGYVYNGLVVDDPMQTFINIQNQAGRFIAGIIGWVVIFVCDLIVAYSLYVFMKGVNKRLATITGVLRAIYTLVLGFAIGKLVNVMCVVQEGATIQNASDVHGLLGSFEGLWSAGLIIFGLHLVGLGYLAIRSVHIPMVWGILLLFAGVCYIYVHGAKLCIPGVAYIVDDVEQVLSAPMALAEIGFAIWLMIKGRKLESA